MNREQLKLGLILTTVALVCPGTFPSMSIGQESPKKIEAEVQKKDGLETVSFDTLEGTVIDVNLPDDIEASDTISGTVVTEKTEPENPSEVAQGEDELNGYVVEIAKTKELKEPEKVTVAATPPAPVVTDKCPQVKPVLHKLSSFACLIASVTPTIEIRLINPQGVQVASKTITCSSTRKVKLPSCTIPSSGTCDKPLRIPGPCDGRSITSSVKINGSACPVLAESPRQQVCLPPKNVSGKWQIERSECGKVTRGTISMLPPQPRQPRIARKQKPEKVHGGNKAFKQFNLTGSWAATSTTCTGQTSSATITITQAGNSCTLVAGITYTGTISGNTIVFHNELPPTSTDWTMTYDPATDTLVGNGIMKSDTMTVQWTSTAKRQ